jgi:small subunit ribosomal protein S2
MVSERAFTTETADIRPLPTESHFLGEEEDGYTDVPVQESTGTAEASVEDVEGAEDVENIDLDAVLGGGIKKAPAAATEPDPEVQPEHVEASA